MKPRKVVRVIGPESVAGPWRYMLDVAGFRVAEEGVVVVLVSWFSRDEVDKAAVGDARVLIAGVPAEIDAGEFSHDFCRTTESNIGMLERVRAMSKAKRGPKKRRE